MIKPPIKKIQTGGNYADKMRSITKPQAAMGSMGENPMMTKKMRKGGDVQSESSKLEQKNAAADKAQEEGYKRYQAEQAKEAKENAGPREAVGKAVDYIKKGLGMKSGGSVKSASSRADGCAIRGKTRAQYQQEAT